MSFAVLFTFFIVAASARHAGAGASSFVPLREAAKGIERVRIGAASPASLLANATSAYAKTMAQNYDLTTAENACKWGATEKSRGKFSFDECDAVRDFAHNHNMSFRGHNLCWGHYNPDWLKTLSPSEKRTALIEHIEAVVKHYGASPVAWDVVNEAISDKECDNPWCFKASDWYPDVPDFVYAAFETARKAAPRGVKLFYNDYSIANANSAKAKRVLNLVKNLTASRVIDGVGLQMHVSRGWENQNGNSDGLIKTMEQYRQLGIEVHITEMDVKNPEPRDDAAQTKTYVAALSACLNSTACTNFETWGWEDGHTWIGTSEHPLPFDKGFLPKKAALALSEALLNA